MPAEAGIQSSENGLDSRLRGNDVCKQGKFYATIECITLIFAPSIATKNQTGKGSPVLLKN
jgi:hypothetical protein